MGVWAAALLLAESACPQSLPPKRTPGRARQEWLKAEHDKVLKDSERLVVLTRNLRFEAAQPQSNPLPPGTVDRTSFLEDKAKELMKATEAVDENFLSLRVVTLAADIRDVARLLRKSFEESPARAKLVRFRLFAREIERRADSIHKRTREP